MKTLVFTQIEDTIKTLDVASISPQRKDVLQPLINFIQEKVDKKEAVLLNFICTHNSRRSHLSQIWAQVMGAYFDIQKVFTYSGGTEATAMFPKVGETLSAQGLEIIPLSDGNNPVYAVKYAENAHPIVAFSKTYDHAFNPTSNFAAVMTCSQADAGCPFIAGTEKRIPITYDDPKAFDGTPQQAEKYKERSLHIATELFYVFSKISK
ncbi:low molecular weight phosphatase family protein [Mongoliibacter ruber]|uniref:Arsenate reductase n=1 Tax=Mongoliibacter ruber TaxID=1750599 RepID=A0A2T0WSQ8_9BACT|nr:protein-tyrosine-phosphatase [Mongoliibacter ruber]PRY89729.1 arsenate reductase [Mongoliibacter ruber]